MGCRIIVDTDNDLACMFCSTSDVAFGPVFSKGDDGQDARDRILAFFRWIDSDTCQWKTFETHPAVFRKYNDRDPRVLTDAGLQAAYSTWLAQEADQQQREQQDHEQVSS